MSTKRLYMNERNVIVNHYEAARQEAYDLLKDALRAKYAENDQLPVAADDSEIAVGIRCMGGYIRSQTLDIVSLRKPALLVRIELELALHRTFNSLAQNLGLFEYLNPLLNSMFLSLTHVGLLCEEAVQVAERDSWSTFRKAELESVMKAIAGDDYILDRTAEDHIPPSAFFNYVG